MSVASVRSQFESLKPVTSTVSGIEFYVPSKNIHFMVVNKKKFVKADLTKFDDVIKSCHPTIMIIINLQETPMVIEPIQTDNIVGIKYILSPNDITDRFVNYLASAADLNTTEMNRVTQLNAKATAPVVPKESCLEKYGDSEQDFRKYCEEVVKSKLEYEKAKAKWPEYMKIFAKKEDFIKYTATLKTKDEVRTNKTSNIEEFHEFVKMTPTSKISKKIVKEKFPDLSEEITFVDLLGDEYKAKLNSLKAELKKKDELELKAQAKTQTKA